MSIKLAKKPELKFTTISGVKVTSEDAAILEKYADAYKEAYGKEISLGDIVSLAAMEFVRSDKTFMKTVE